MDSVLADFSRSRTTVNHACRDLAAPVTKSMTNGCRPAEVKHNLARRGEVRAMCTYVMVGPRWGILRSVAKGPPLLTQIAFGARHR